MNPNIFPPAMDKQQCRLGSSALVRQLFQEKKNSEFKPVRLRLKIDLVSYPARVEGLGKYDITVQTNDYYTHLESTEIMQNIEIIMIMIKNREMNPISAANDS